jgi:hypothetical protein
VKWWTGTPEYIFDDITVQTGVKEIDRFIQFSNRDDKTFNQNECTAHLNNTLKNPDMWKTYGEKWLIEILPSNIDKEKSK